MHASDSASSDIANQFAAATDAHTQVNTAFIQPVAYLASHSGNCLTNSARGLEKEREKVPRESSLDDKVSKDWIWTGADPICATHHQS